MKHQPANRLCWQSLSLLQISILLRILLDIGHGDILRLCPLPASF
jgi:hypothetical protein